LKRRGPVYRNKTLNERWGRGMEHSDQVIGPIAQKMGRKRFHKEGEGKGRPERDTLFNPGPGGKERENKTHRLLHRRKKR